ncbi:MULTISPECIES: PepSY-associated TM helix domain-containing protein [Cyanophyceae]|uniref:PepSY-associated TM helix domain-containing protein n=1 Tax=Cyanophyceae TaxID=3028117 RepID=UPI001685519B|nr:PepSY-associated TM helix domain-containing protein [Trichocoleus sp. FACHB-69]MBD1932808.1 PepSY domain-containing protein [Trichocoleus sp. FACHB-69]
MKLRKPALILHRIVGVIVGLLLIVIGLTGSALVFWHEIDHSRNLTLMEVVPQSDRISLETVAKNARQAYPDFMPDSIELARSPELTHQVWMKSKDDKWNKIYINPYTGAVLGSRQWGKTLMTFIYDIHKTLLAGETGQIVVGVCGILLLLLGITGLILWPGWKRFGQGFKIRWNSPKQLVNYDIHKVGGILSAAFLILLASTGAALAFNSQFESVIYGLTNTQTPAEPKSTLVPNKSPIPLNAALQKASLALPEGEATYISLPSEPDVAFRVTIKLPQEATPSGRSNVYVDQYSGEVLRVENSLKLPLGTKIMNALFPMHMGNFGGIPMRILYVFIGFTPTVLFITGFALWRQRQWAMARRKEAMFQSQSLPEEKEKILTTTAWPWI